MLLQSTLGQLMVLLITVDPDLSIRLLLRLTNMLPAESQCLRPY